MQAPDFTRGYDDYFGEDIYVKEIDDQNFSSLYHTGDYVYVHGAAATPLPLLESLAAHGKSEKLKDVNLIHIHTEGPGICQQPEYEGKYSLKFLHGGWMPTICFKIELSNW